MAADSDGIIKRAMQTLTMAFALLQDFWNRVDHQADDACWNWLACKDQKGYGFATHHGRQYRVHRLMMFSLGHDICGQVVRHTCDNPACVNPRHLCLGSSGDNVRDRQNRNRQAKGPKIHTAKLTENAVAEIRALYPGLPRSKSGRLAWGELAKLANRFGISKQQMRYVLTGKFWKHVGGVT